MKIIIDILLFIFMLLEFQRNYISPVLHEIFGIILIVLLTIHLILNKNYIKNIFKGKYNPQRSTMLVINILFMLTFILSIIFGLLSSQNLLKPLNIQSLTILKLHKIFSYISLIFLGLHLGINLRNIKLKNKLILYIIETPIIIYGIYAFIKLDILKHITGTYGFSIKENIVINIFNYLIITLMITIITHNIYKLIKKGNKK